MSFSFVKVMQFLSRNRILMIKTICLLLGNMFYSINENTIGPALIDLTFIYNSTIASVELGTSLLFAGYMIGSFVSSLYRWLDRQLVLVGILSLQVITFVTIPFLANVWQYYIVIILFGVTGGAWESSAIVWIVEMWCEGSRSLLHLLQSMYSIGMIIAPLFVAPFLFGELESVEGIDGAKMNITGEMRSASIQTPFVAIASCNAIIPITLLIMYFIQPFEKKVEKAEKSDQMESKILPELMLNKRASIASLGHFEHVESQLPVPDVPYRALKFIFAGLAYATYLSLQLNFIFFQTTMWQLLPIGMSAQESATMASALSAAHTIGRLMTIFISIKVIPDVIVSYHYIILVIGQVVLFMGRDTKLWITIGTVLTGLGFSALMAAHLAFTSRHLGLGKLAGSIYSFTTGLLGLTIPIVISSLISHYPLILFQCSGVFLTISIVSFVIVVLLIKCGSKQ